MLDIHDRDLPGLAGLNQARLRELTGAQEVTLLRLRYRAGKRAILHLSADHGAKRREGTLWFFKGDKARRLARRNKSARFDPATAALFETFPNDHRMPQIRDFLERYEDILPDLAGAEAAGAPQMLRYRPGLSCTFRCPVAGPRPVFVKLINDDAPARLLAANHAMRRTLAAETVNVAPALNMDPSVSAIAYGAAPGQPLDAAMMAGNNATPLQQAIAALRIFWQTPLVPGRIMGPEMLLARARESAAFVGVTAPCCAARVNALAARLEAHLPQVDLRPIHADMKLEHLFIHGSSTTLIDTESVALGPPDYDFAQLCGRLWQAELEGQMPRDLVRAAAADLRNAAGPAFGWCLGVVALRLAKFYAQRPTTDMAQKITAMLERLE